MFQLRLIGVFGLSLCLALGAQAQGQWKWRDAQGNIQYSDRPPPQGTPEKDILARPARVGHQVRIQPVGQASAPATAAPAASDPAAERRAAEQRQRQGAAAAAKAKAEEQRLAAARAENCKHARLQLQALESGVRMAQINDKGERIIMNDSARQAEIARAKLVIASDCK